MNSTINQGAVHGPTGFFSKEATIARPGFSEELTMHLRFFVRTIRPDGSATLSQPFTVESKARRWARLARRDTAHVARTVVIARRVQPIDASAYLEEFHA